MDEILRNDLTFSIAGNAISYDSTTKKNIQRTKTQTIGNFTVSFYTALFKRDDSPISTICSLCYNGRSMCTLKILIRLNLN